MLKQVFLAHFEPVVTRFGPWKIPKSFENGLFRDQKSVKNGSKPRFSKSDPRPPGMLKQVFLAHFELMVMLFRGCTHLDHWDAVKGVAHLAVHLTFIGLKTRPVRFAPGGLSFQADKC